MPRKPVIFNKTVTWLSDEITNEQAVSNSFHYYKKFQFKSLVCEIGDFVLISNADSAEPDTEGGCDAARIVSLYEDSSNKNDPCRAKVQWYSKPADLPNSSFTNMEPVDFIEKEVLEDHRPFDTDVSIETFFKKCSITLTFTSDTDLKVKVPYHYICRYRVIAVSKRRVQLEPVLEEERKALQYLSTPTKLTPGRSSRTPTSLIKRMGRVSIAEHNSWRISTSDGTKLLLKRAILADKNDKDSPKNDTTKTTPKTVYTPKNKNLTRNNIEDLLTMELKESSDDELPTLIIRQHEPTTPSRRSTVSKTSTDTPKKVLLFDEEKEIYSTRSGRVTKNPVSYVEPELSPVKQTPRKSIRKSVIYLEKELSPIKKTPQKTYRSMNTEESDDDFKPSPKTPKTPKTRTPRATPGKTPKGSISKRVITSQLTPTLHSRVHSVDNTEEKTIEFCMTGSLEFLKENKSLPGREHQMEEILSFVRSKLLNGTSGHNSDVFKARVNTHLLDKRIPSLTTSPLSIRCMYISGVPGTGKTATVCSALKFLKEESDLPDFQLVEVNGMRIAEPRQAYVQIYKQLTGKSVVWEQACALLEKRFTSLGPRRTPTVLLVDELDALCTRRQDVLYSIMEWAAHTSALLTVLAVANTMDLPERALAARVASRLGLTRLAFPPYTHSQLQSIVAARLHGADVTPDAVQLIARKVAAVSGDARRALALCARALELAGRAGTGAGLRQVQQALGEAASSAAVRAIQHCAPAERLMLRAVAAEVERTGSDETTLSRALATAAAIVALDGRGYRAAAGVRAPSAAQARAACARLAALRLLLLQPSPAEPRLLLNVSADDVHYATRQTNV